MKPKSDRYLFVHGLGLSGSIWANLVQIITLPVHTPDLPGHGAGPRGQYDFGAMWTHIEQHIPHEEWLNTTLVLHSMSSGLLPELVASNTRPAALVLIEGNLTGADTKWSREISCQPREQFDQWFARIRKASTLVLRSQLIGSHDPQDLISWGAGFTEVETDALRQIAANLIERSESGAIARALATLDLPTIYLRGYESRGLDESCALLARLCIPVIKIPGAAHYPMIDNPRATWQAISSSY
jgi:pimeloyl-ACP methyl ester carboxylesterase